MSKVCLVFNYDSKEFMNINKILIFKNNYKRILEKGIELKFFFYGDASREEIATFMGYFNKLAQIKICDISVSYRTKELIFENGINKYLAYNDENFTRCFKMSVNKMLESFGLNSTGEIEIQPIKPKKTVVNTFGNKITGNIGAFLLKAEPETLNHLYKLGVGSRRSQGFSMFEIAVKAAQS